MESVPKSNSTKDERINFHYCALQNPSVRHLNNTTAPVLMKSANPSFVRNGTHSPAATRLKLFGTLIRLYSESCCRVTRALRNYILDGRSYKSSKCARGGKEKKNKISRTNQPYCSQMYGNLAIPANVLGWRFLEINFATVTSSSDRYNIQHPPTQVPPHFG
jgi:hypothetical protein